MKEATGELNMTVITVVAIAAIAGFFYVFLWPVLKNNIEASQKCASAICPSTCTPGQACSSCVVQGSNETVTCVVRN